MWQKLVQIGIILSPTNFPKAFMFSVIFSSSNLKIEAFLPRGHVQKKFHNIVHLSMHPTHSTLLMC